MDWENLRRYQPQTKLRFVTATALFDGHDASINIFRRLLQHRGVEVIHLGHNRSAAEVANAALAEDVQAVAVSSYQGGHHEFLSYLRQLLDEGGGQQIKIFAGGGGVITLDEIADLENNRGINKIFTPEDGQVAGLDGIIGYMLQASDYQLTEGDSLPRLLTRLEAGDQLTATPPEKTVPVLGVTGTGGAGKSSLIDELLLRFIADFPELKIAVICIDPSKSKTGGALLGDRLRMNSLSDTRIFLRSFATRGSTTAVTSFLHATLQLLQTQNLFNLIIVETSGIGQADSSVVKVADHSLYVMTPEYGAQSQLEKIDMLDYADFIAINKFDRRQALDALRDVRTVIRRTRFSGSRTTDNHYPVFGVIANRFNDDGVNALYNSICAKIFPEHPTSPRPANIASTNRQPLIPEDRQNYLFEIAQKIRAYHADGEKILATLKEREAIDQILSTKDYSSTVREELNKKRQQLSISPMVDQQLNQWRTLDTDYRQDNVQFKVRGRQLEVASSYLSVARNRLPKIARPQPTSDSELFRYLSQENLPGYFPYTAGIMPFRRIDEQPKRQFAGEGGPEQTNRRFHFLSADEQAKRLSTAFDSVTLYGSDPAARPDIGGKVGESGVSIATLDDMKKLFAGFDLCDPQTSVSMTINGPAPIILAMYLNTAIDQQLAQQPTGINSQQIIDQTLQRVRGTVQSDILKEDQAQNTCIFSTEFALRMMGDVQAYFIEKNIKKYYSVSISGFHIAEAGANPVTQLAFTLANGFTYVEYYLARGMKIDDFAPNLSFFFSNGLDAEYSVIGRVARRIWAIAMRDVYRANDDSQKLKYHVQTSGRSLHAQEMAFNDIRTTLQALLALCENCNSLHTNAFDEALTTPTEESVRRAMAIQVIINQELGINQCENFFQGSYALDQLTDLVEQQVLQEFENIARRGGVLGAMETQYQRAKIQEESLYYEELKHSGELPIAGVNTFLATTQDDNNQRQQTKLVRATPADKKRRLVELQQFKDQHRAKKDQALARLQTAVLEPQGNIFAELMHCVRHATLQEITDLLYMLGGKYRRLM